MRRPTWPASRATQPRSGSRRSAIPSWSSFDQPATDFPALVSGPCVRGRASLDRRPGQPRPGDLRGQRRLRPVGPNGHRADPDRQPQLLGRPAADHDRPPADDPRRKQPGRGVRGRDRRLHRDRRFGCLVAALRPDARPAAPERALPERHVLRLRRAPEALRRRAGPPGIRPGRRLDQDREPGQHRLAGARDEHGPARDPGPIQHQLPACLRPGRRPPGAGRCRLSGWGGHSRR